MQEIIDKIIERLEEEKESATRRYSFDSELSYSRAIKIVKQVAEECKDKHVSIGAYKQVAWERDIAIEQLHELGYEFGQKIDKEFCEWFKYDYRTIAPKNHDIGNPYWRIPEDMSRLRYCSYCGKKIKVVG